jgi:hypothetical protein
MFNFNYIISNMILFSKILNETAMAAHIESFSLVNFTVGIIKVSVYRKGVKKFIEKKICYQ